MSEHKPMMSKEEVEKRRIWQEEVYQTLKKIDKECEVCVMGKKIMALPGVFAPLWGDSLSLAEVVQKETKQGDFVLDLGTGTGIQGVFSAEKASKVIASDISPKAVECVKFNVKNLKLDDKIKVIESDLFSNIQDKFDLIIFNPPFRWFKPKDPTTTPSFE